MENINLNELNEIQVKWPQMIVTGKKVTIDQAREIILATDSFFDGYQGNDSYFDDELCKMFDLPIYQSDVRYTTYDEYREKRSSSLKKINHDLYLNHFSTHWLSSCYVGGPYGWCHPNGDIFDNHNIGKWPTWDEIIEDLTVLGQRFQFLDMNVYVMDGDMYDEDKKCYGGLRLFNGQVTGIEENDMPPIDSDIFKSADFYSEFFNHRKNVNNLRHEKEGVVNIVDNSLFHEECPEEHLFRMEELVEYFKDYIRSDYCDCKDSSLTTTTDGL